MGNPVKGKLKKKKTWQILTMVMSSMVSFYKSDKSTDFFTHSLIFSVYIFVADWCVISSNLATKDMFKL